jgi:hypothetical protein
LAPRRINHLWLLTRNARSDQLKKYKFDSNGRENSELEMLTAYWKTVLLKHLPAMISSLDSQYNIKDNMPPHFSKTFLKGRAYYRTPRKWLERKDTIAVKLKKTAFILSSLKEVEETCLEEHEARYSCPGFFKIFIQFLALELKIHSESGLPDLSKFELEKYLLWRLTAGEIFSTNSYRKFYRLP